MYLNHIASLRCHWNRLFMRNLNLGCPVLFCAILCYYGLFCAIFTIFWQFLGHFWAKLNIFGVKKYVLEPGNSVVIFSCNFHKLFCTFFAILCYYWLFCAIFTIFGQLWSQSKHTLCQKLCIWVWKFSGDTFKRLSRVIMYYFVLLWGFCAIFSKSGPFLGHFWVKVNNILSNFSKFPRISAKSRSLILLAKWIIVFVLMSLSLPNFAQFFPGNFFNSHFYQFWLI